MTSKLFSQEYDLKNGICDTVNWSIKVKYIHFTFTGETKDNYHNWTANRHHPCPAPLKMLLWSWAGKTDTSNGCISGIIQLIALWSHLVFRCRGSWVVLWWRNICVYERDQRRSHCLDYTPHLHIPTPLIHSCTAHIPRVTFNTSNCSLQHIKQ